MSSLSKLTILGSLVVVSLAYADTVNLVTTPAALGANDTVIWSPQLGADGATIANTFGATSTGGKAVAGSFSTTTGLVAKVCSGCSWSPLTGDFTNNDFLIWSFDASTSSGTGAVTFTFPSASGVGAVVQADAPGQFTVQVELFNGATSLGLVTRTSNAAGDAIFIGALDTTGANANKAVFSLTAGPNNGTPNFLGDFATGPLSLNVPVAVLTPDFLITKTHVGNFTQGQTGATYTITVSNTGTGSTSGLVTVTDTVPAGLTATSIAGTGWICTPPSGSCTRSDALAAAASYPAITLTVNVSATAPASVTNSASVAGGGVTADADDTANDPTTINASGVPDLTVTKTHTGNFTQGQTGATYTITVTNSGTASTTGTVTINDTIPAGLTATAISGAGWMCTQPSGPCTASATLAPSASYSSITLTVNVAPNAPASVTNSASVSGGGETNTANDIANDPTTIQPLLISASDGPFQVRYASNLAIGDSVVNITNTGAGSSVSFPTQNGNLCANVYTFSPDEQLISCCSCLVTPNALVSLSARNDLISNTLTPGVPTSIVVKLVASTGTTAASCNASTVGTGNNLLATGMAAFGTTIHALPVTPGTPSTTYGGTETRFTNATLSGAELARITALCGFIQTDGSGFGICRSCRFGGLGDVQPQ